MGERHKETTIVSTPNTKEDWVPPIDTCSDDQLAPTEWVARWCGLKPKTVRNRWYAGRFPAPEKQDPHGRLFWRVGVIRAYLKGQTELGA